MNKLRGINKFNESMAPYSSWKIGGLADELYIPADIEDLSLFLSRQNKPVTFIGLGSNVLIADKGIRGTVILMKGGLTEITLTKDKLEVDAGVSCAKLSRFATNNGLSGLAFLAGIPGTVGGALKMNAGAFGNETWSFVSSAKVINARGEVSNVRKDELNIQYRHVALDKGLWFVKAVFDLRLCRQESKGLSIKTLLKKRKENQPIGLASCGSVFKNPENDFAARLIEESELKGKQIGQAQVSFKHANFIINLGGALASDVKKLIEFIQQVVMDKFAVKLETEVHFIGDF